MKTAHEARKVLADLKQSIAKMEELFEQTPSTAMYAAIETCRTARRVIKHMLAEFGDEGTHMPTPPEDPTIPRISDADDSGEVRVDTPPPTNGIPAAKVVMLASHADETEDLPARVRDLAQAVVMLARGQNATAIPVALAVIKALGVG